MGTEVVGSAREEVLRRIRVAIARINAFTQEYVTGMSLVQLFNREDRAFRDFSAVNRVHLPPR